MMHRKKHPYERNNPERGSEDVIKTFKNHAQAISLFALFVIVGIVLAITIFAFTFPSLDLNLIFVLISMLITAILIMKPVHYILSKLFKDPSKGILLTCLITGPFIITLLMLINSLITFESGEEKFHIESYVSQYHRTKHGGYRDYKMTLQNNAFDFQPGFRTVSYPPSGQYIHYKFRRGILGLRVLQETHYSD